MSKRARDDDDDEVVPFPLKDVSDEDDDTFAADGSYSYIDHKAKEKETLHTLCVTPGGKKAASEDFYRLKVVAPEEEFVTEEYRGVAAQLQEAMTLREKYVYLPNIKNFAGVDPTPKAPFSPFEGETLGDSEDIILSVDGVWKVYSCTEDASKDAPKYEVIAMNEYYKDLQKILKTVAFGPVKTFCWWRLQTLQARFNLHALLNAPVEARAQKLASHRDFYNIRKVDTHIHHSSSMNCKHLLRFIKKKLRTEGKQLVIYRDERYLTLEEVFTSLGLTAYDLSVDKLDVHADKNTFHRFDKFNLKYNPIGESRLREIFLKQNNHIKGRYLAEITKELFEDYSLSKYQNAEPRISIYGSDKGEWAQLASWIVENRLYSDNVRWLIQVPRLYNIYKAKGLVENFQEYLDNIFQPLFEVTKNPSANLDLHFMLQQVVGFDCVDDESKAVQRVHKRYPSPSEWNFKHNPPFSYYQYFMYANITSLNKFRNDRGLHALAYRPHAGETGDLDHLAATFLVAHSINHGIQLRKSPCLQYLYYLKQIGIAMSPLSNNSLFLEYNRSPLPDFLARGLNVSLSTDDPLQFHHTKEPLIEEYTIAKQVFKLSSTDIAEIARNSVIQSGFEHPVKQYWLGREYDAPHGNDIERTNLPDIRVQYRTETLKSELENLEGRMYAPVTPRSCEEPPAKKPRRK